ncbi:MAG: hypothetical protein WAQ27_00825 [Candidatus Microsaccharimonas sp.]
MAFVLPVALVALVMTGCSGGPAAPSQTDDNGSSLPDIGVSTTGDPREGWVVVTTSDDNSMGTDVIKGCDGTTMLYLSDGYNSGGITSVKDDPECVPNPE